MSRVAGAAEGSGSAGARGYFERSLLPLSSLVFLLPFVVLYEIGTPSAPAGPGGRQIIAFMLMQRFFRFFGVSGQHLPALAVVVILLSWHIVRNDRWHIDFGILVGMLVESLLLAFPLIVLGRLMAQYFPLAAGVQDTFVMSLGAGVYEELVFRLVLFSILSLVFKDALGIRSGWLNFWIVCASGLLFSAYHYLSPNESFHWHIFAFRAVAGAYFGVLFLLRGFGITAASHAAYDVMIFFL